MASTNAHHDGYELRVRTDEIKSYRSERVSSNLTYEGRSVVLNADITLPIWQLKRIVTFGSQTYWEWANEGQYTAAWDQRATNVDYWPAGLLLDNQFSLEFDGINDRVEFASTAFTGFDISNQWSMSFWIWVDNLSSQRCIYSKTTQDASVNGFSIQLTTAGNVFIQMRTASTQTAYTGSAIVAPQTWTNIIVTYSGASNINGIRVYKNAVVDTTPGSAPIVGSLHVGQTPMMGSRGTAFNFSGNIDEPSFWTKTLSQAEVTALYALPPSSVQLHSAAAVSLEHWWRMGDGDTFPTIVDQVDAQHGTMTGMMADDIVAEVP